jgi:hypothetical protein
MTKQTASERPGGATGDDRDVLRVVGVEAVDEGRL